MLVAVGCSRTGITGESSVVLFIAIRTKIHAFVVVKVFIVGREQAGSATYRGAFTISAEGQIT